MSSSSSRYPEWGHPTPARGLPGMIPIALVAMAVGATSSAGAVLALVGQTSQYRTSVASPSSNIADRQVLAAPTERASEQDVASTPVPTKPQVSISNKNTGTVPIIADRKGNSHSKSAIRWRPHTRWRYTYQSTFSRVW